MVLVIDCFKQVKGAGKSIGIYNLAKNIIRNLAAEQKMADSEEVRDSRIIVLGNALNRSDFEIPGTEFICIDRNPLNKGVCVLWELFWVSGVCKNLKADRVLFPRGFCALSHPVKDTVIIHDLIPFYYDRHFPGVLNRVENAYIMNRMKASIRQCDQVITISEASRKEILEVAAVSPDKITVIYNGLNALAKESQKEQGRYIAAIASGLPHKNAVGIVRSYEEYCRISPDPLPLTLVGVEDITRYGVPDEVAKRITCHKYIVEDKELHRILADAEVFLFLSLVEGFGLPPVEAMQLGVPVICSNMSSLPEVVGDAAVLVDPNGYREVADALESLVNDLPRKRELIEKGYENCRRFSWESRAKRYWNVLIRK